MQNPLLAHSEHNRQNPCRMIHNSSWIKNSVWPHPNLMQTPWTTHAWFVQIHSKPFRNRPDPIQNSFSIHAELIQNWSRIHSELIQAEFSLTHSEFIQISFRTHAESFQISSRTHPDPFQISFTFSQYDLVPWDPAVRISSVTSHYELVLWEPRTTN